LTKGVFILLFGIGILIDIAAKLQDGAPPSSTPMMILVASRWQPILPVCGCSGASEPMT
jgi:hypothetical protein